MAAAEEVAAVAGKPLVLFLSNYSGVRGEVN